MTRLRLMAYTAIATVIFAASVPLLILLVTQ